MEQSEILFRLLITIIFGAILGLETEVRASAIQKGKEHLKAERERIGGLRTYTILSLFGGISGLFYSQELHELVYISFGGLIGLVLIAYAMNIKHKKAFGITTEIAIFMAFLIGFLTTSAILDLIVIAFILILLTFFLSQKRGFGSLIQSIAHEELIDMIKFGLIILVVFPLLPNETYTVSDLLEFGELSNLGVTNEDILNIGIINPARIWLIVIVISSINFVGYVLGRLIGNKSGLLVTSIVGGFISSTSTTVALAEKSKQYKSDSAITTLASGAVLANAVSYVTTILLLIAINTDLLTEAAPSLIAMLLIGLLVGAIPILVQQNKKFTKQQFEVGKYEFSLLPTLRFVGLIVLITVIIQFAQLVDNDIILLGVTAVSGFTGLDASVIATGELANKGELSLALATGIILLTNLVNLVAKIFYAYMSGTKSFALAVGVGLMITLLGSVVSFIV